MGGTVYLTGNFQVSLEIKQYLRINARLLNEAYS